MFGGNLAAMKEALMRARSQAEAQSGAARGAVEHVASGLADLGRGFPHRSGGWQLPSRSGPEGPAPQATPVPKPAPEPQSGGMWGAVRDLVAQQQAQPVPKPAPSGMWGGLANAVRHGELNPNPAPVGEAAQPVPKPVPDLGGWGGIRRMLQQAQMRQASGGSNGVTPTQVGNVRNAFQNGLFRR